MKKIILLTLVALAAQMANADVLYVERNGKWYEYYDLDSLDCAEQLKGWEWVNDETPETVYIKGGTGKKYASHPQYIVKGLCVYNKVGTLIRVLDYPSARKDWDKIDKDDDSDNKYTNGQLLFTWALIRQDYTNNVQGIKNAGKDVVYSLTYKLGMNPQAEREKKALKKRLTDSIINSSFAKTKRQKDQAGWAFLGALSQGDKFNHPRANQFIADRREVHAGDVDIVYSVERLTPTSFKIITLDEDGNATHAFKLAFAQNGQFNVKGTTMTIIPIGSFKGTNIEWERNGSDDSDDDEDDSDDE